MISFFLQNRFLHFFFFSFFLWSVKVVSLCPVFFFFFFFFCSNHKPLLKLVIIGCSKSLYILVVVIYLVLSLPSPFVMIFYRNKQMHEVLVQNMMNKRVTQKSSFVL